MNILIASSEVVPFAKTGGLADVVGSLPVELTRLGHPATVFVPAYRSAYQSGQPLKPTEVVFDIPVGNKVVSGRLLESRLPDSDVRVYLVERPEYYDRQGIYRDARGDYKDNCERYVFFCRAVMESIRFLKLPVDILHCNDWPTGLLPALLRLEYSQAAGYQRMASLLTIHNLAYQGSFWHWDMLLTGLDWKHFNWHEMEFYNQLNLLKTGIVFADAINTVSPRYAEEIQGPEHGCGLEGVLRHRRDVLSGIINGVDYHVWNPELDQTIAAVYSAANWKEGKAACKEDLQQRMGLPVSPRIPVLGLVGRLADQKGWDLVIDVMRSWVPRVDVQWAILGTGDEKYHRALAELAAEFPGKVAVQLAFSDESAHLIEAGADIFPMPSRFEPCGLNQLYSLKYGTIPVVHATGGLEDTIIDATPERLRDGSATGFQFREYTQDAFQAALRRALEVYQQQPEIWNRMVINAMKQDWSWERSARKYVELYAATLAHKFGG